MAKVLKLAFVIIALITMSVVLTTSVSAHVVYCSSAKALCEDLGYTWEEMGCESEGPGIACGFCSEVNSLTDDTLIWFGYCKADHPRY
jgi:hypothetical protein